MIGAGGTLQRKVLLEIDAQQGVEHIPGELGIIRAVADVDQPRLLDRCNGQIALEPLEQTYTRIEAQRYRYESAGGGFVADVTVDEAGLVIDYGKIWSREVAA